METVTPRIQILEDGDTRGKFVVEPLEQGFGYTIGNALRRVLLSSIPGAAVTSIQIDGVLHEFSTIPGVKEDTTELMLNLRELYVKLNAPEDAEAQEYEVFIDVHGPGEVTAADIKCPPEVEIANPELHIAFLNNEKTVLKMKMTVERGKGYVLPEKQERVKRSSIGVIPIGAVYTPVRKVSYTVEPTRVGHKTDYDRLVVDVSTNGTVRPSDAVSDAAAILCEQIEKFINFARTSRGGRTYSGGAGANDIPAPDTKIDDLDFSVRTPNCLKKANVYTVRELVQFSEGELMRIRSFGKKSLDEVKMKLDTLGLKLRESSPAELSQMEAEGFYDDEADIDDSDDGGEV